MVQRELRRDQLWTSSRWVANFVELEEVSNRHRCRDEFGEINCAEKLSWPSLTNISSCALCVGGYTARLTLT